MKKFYSFMAMVAIAAMLLACGKDNDVNKVDDQTEQTGENNGENTGEETTKGDLQFAGNIVDGAELNYGSDAAESIDLGYWYAQTRETGANDWVTMEASVAENLPLYKDVVFTVKDASGADVTWAKVGYGAVDGVINSTHWILSLEENAGDANRSAIVTATFPDKAAGYVLAEGFKTRTITINQSKKVAEDEIIGDMTFKVIQNRATEFSFGVGALKNQNLFYNAVSIRPTGGANWQTVEANSDESYYQWTYSVIDDATGAPATWLTVARRAKDTWTYVDLDANTGAARSATVTITFPDVVKGYKLLEGDETFTFTIKQAEYVAIDYTTELWSAATIAKTWYSKPNWAGGLTADVTLSADGKTFSSVVPEGIGNAEWHGQNFILSEILMDANKRYKFSTTVTTTVTGVATVKLALWNPTGGDDGKGGDVNEIFYDNNVQVTAGTPLNYEKEYLAGVVNSDFKVVLIIDLGRAAGNSTWTFSNISLKSN